MTSACPENVSSMWLLSRPVRRHCWTNIPCERFITAPVTSIETGTETRATRASTGEIQNIIPSTATTVSSEVSSWLRVCWRVGADVVDVVGDAAQQLAARLAVDVGQRQPVHLVLDVGAHPAHGALHDVVEEVAGQPAESGRADVDREHEQQHLAHGGEVDALAGHDVHAADHVGDLVVAALAEQVDGLVLGQPVGQPAADHARRR